MSLVNVPPILSGPYLVSFSHLALFKYIYNILLIKKKLHSILHSLIPNPPHQSSIKRITLLCQLYIRLITNQLYGGITFTLRSSYSMHTLPGRAKSFSSKIPLYFLLVLIFSPPNFTLYLFLQIMLPFQVTCMRCLVSFNHEGLYIYSYPWLCIRAVRFNRISLYEWMTETRVFL